MRSFPSPVYFVGLLRPLFLESSVMLESESESESELELWSDGSGSVGLLSGISGSSSDGLSSCGSSIFSSGCGVSSISGFCSGRSSDPSSLASSLDVSSLDSLLFLGSSSPVSNSSSSEARGSIDCLGRGSIVLGF